MTVADLITKLETLKTEAKSDLDILLDKSPKSDEVKAVLAKHGHKRLLQFDENTVMGGIRVLANLCLERYKQLETTIFWVKKAIDEEIKFK